MRVFTARRSFIPFAALALAALFATAPVGAADAGAAFPDPAIDIPLAKDSGAQTAVLAGGCFWGVQAVFQHVDGVLSATSGYAGGAAASANYRQVSSGDSGHAEAVRIVFNPARVSYGQLLKIFFSVAHDPTQLNRQGPDRGTQYRSAIFYGNDEQQRVARAYLDRLGAARVYSGPIVTQLAPLAAFYPAEAYHQDYARTHPDDPYIVINDRPKVSQLKNRFPALYRAEPPR